MLYHSPKFDLMTVPAGTFAVHLAASLQNNDNTVASFRCELLFREPAGVEYGEVGQLGLFAKGPADDPTDGTLLVDQFITFPVRTDISAYCLADEGDQSHSAFVSRSTLTATRLLDPHGTADPFTVTLF